MSRIGKNPIAIAKGVQVTLAGSAVSMKGPKGSASLDCRDHVKVSQVESHLEVARHSDDRQDRAYHGLYQRLIASMMKGVTEGFTKELQLVGVGYRASMDGKTLVMTLGYSHEVRFAPPEGITLASPAQDRIVVSGSDKQLVGQIAANIRSLRGPEPYKGKGIRYVNEHIRRKVGKTRA
ncbi:50S ribosomal protein L6 [bacterium]|nr:50S ribosomal protein L6 [bacterium]